MPLASAQGARNEPEPRAVPSAEGTAHQGMRY
jgi:hypothetical protein